MSADKSRNGIVTLAGQRSVEETVERLEQALQAKGVTIFAVIDHSGEAEKVGLRMPNTKVVLFGNPKAGTPLMIAAPTIAIDLPMKILVAEDEHGQVRVSYNHPEFVLERHGLPSTLVEALVVAGKIADEIAH